MAKPTEHKKYDAVELQAREGRGSRKAQELRAGGLVPGIVYGLQQEPLKVSLPFAPADAVIHSGAHIMEVILNGKKEKLLIKDVQYDYLNTTIEHVDLQRIDPNQRVRVKVPLEFRGTPKGTKEGGVLQVQLVELELEVKALEIPDLIRVNVEGIELDGMLRAHDVSLPAGAKLINHPDAIVCQVRTVLVEEVAVTTAEAGPAEPEVIGKKKEEEGAEGAEGAAPAGGKAAAPAKK